MALAPRFSFRLMSGNLSRAMRGIPASGYKARGALVLIAENSTNTLASAMQLFTVLSASMALSYLLVAAAPVVTPVGGLLDAYGEPMRAARYLRLYRRGPLAASSGLVARQCIPGNNRRADSSGDVGGAGHLQACF